MQPLRQRIVAKMFHWLMIIMCIVASLWLLRIYGETFQAHLGLFVLLWFLLPSLALWFGSRFMRPKFSTANLSLVRWVLMSGVILISFSFVFCHGYDGVRDAVGHRFVEGYKVYYNEVEDTDEYGRPWHDTAREFYTDHWWAKLGLYVVEGSLLILSVGLPYLTWRACTRAIEVSEKET